MKYKGCAGVVKVDLVKIIELIGFTIDESASVLDATVIGQGCAKKVKGGVTSWNGSIETYYDPNDPGQADLTIGSSVLLELYPSGEAVSNYMITGVAVISGIATPVEIDGAITQSYTYEGSGILTKTELI